MTRITYTQEVSQANHSDKKSLSKEGDQVAYLKRLLVTLKQQYEKALHELNERLQTEIVQKTALQTQFEKSHQTAQSIQKSHEEELAAIKQQQIILRDLLKKSQEELKQLRLSSSSDQAAQRIDQMERMIPYWKERADEANMEAEKLVHELERAQKRIVQLEAELADAPRSTENSLHDSSVATEENGQQYFTDAAQRELAEIKKLLSYESHTFEKKYIETLNEKFALENHFKELQKQLECQSNNLMSFKEQLQSTEQQKRDIEQIIQDQNETIQRQQSYRIEMEKMTEQVQLISDQKIDLEEKYEQLREEGKTLSNQLDDAIESRIHTEEYLSNMISLAKEQEMSIEEQNNQLGRLIQEKEELSDELHHIRHAFEECEERFIAAQQHLAKKVKEATLLNEQMNEMQLSYNDCQLQLESAKMQVNHLQTNVELHQRQEKNLQEQLHEALRTTESQASKWEKNYFDMYAKWQEAETRIKELQKLEEKHQQLQNMLSNLGLFMGSSPLTSSPLFREAQESIEKAIKPPFEIVDKSIRSDSPPEERYNLFGMKYPQDTVQ